MTELLVATWNVLHRIHAVNWDEPAIGAHDDEDARNAAIAARVANGALATVTCLQEVSGDQLAALRAVHRGALFAMRYPRVPRYHRRAPTTPGPREPAEYLVTLVAGDAGARELGSEAFASDPGKGFLAIELAGWHVIDTHVTYGDKAPAQFARLLAAAAGHDPVVVLGDCNADRAMIAPLLPGFVAAVPREPALPTRPRTDGSAKSQTIDHVFVRGATIAEARVVSAEGLSDHNPVIAHLVRPS